MHFEALLGELLAGCLRTAWIVLLALGCLALPCLALACLAWIKEGPSFCHNRRSSSWISPRCSRHDDSTIMTSLEGYTATDWTSEPASVEPASSDIPHHILTEVFRYLPQSDVLNVSLVCKRWNAAANADAVWEGLCQQCWSSKVYVRAQPEGSTWKEKFAESYKDGSRIEIERAELCTFEWRFRSVADPLGPMRILEGFVLAAEVLTCPVLHRRLKMAAPQVLRMLDPWHMPSLNPPGLGPEVDVVRPPLLRRKFGADGKLTAQPRDLLAR